MMRTNSPPPRRLAQLLIDTPGVPAHLVVTDLTVSSGEVRPGGAFLACAGRTTHGLAHVAEAIERGACAILWEPVPGLHVPDFPPQIFALPVPQLQTQLGGIADRFFDAPSASLARGHHGYQRQDHDGLAHGAGAWRLWPARKLQRHPRIRVSR